MTVTPINPVAPQPAKRVTVHRLESKLQYQRDRHPQRRWRDRDRGAERRYWAASRYVHWFV